MKRILWLAIVMSILLCSCESGGTNQSGPEESEQSSSETGSAEKDQDNIVGLDGTIAGDFFSLSIVDTQWTDSLNTPFATITPENEGNKLLCIFFEVENTTEETKNLGMLSAYADSHATAQIAIGGEIDGAMPFVGAVTSGMSMKVYAVWELPEDWEEFQLNYFEATGPECQQHFVIHREEIE